MEKSLSATTSFNDHIYDDVALVILSKLPLKSLIRFRCARKSRNLLSNDHSYYDDTSLLLHHSTPWHISRIYAPVLYSLAGERFDNIVKLDWPNPFQEQFDFNFNIYGNASVNGILCIEDTGRVGGIHCIQELQRVVLWNRATSEFKVTPLSPFAFDSPCWHLSISLHGFSYDQVRNDYKVIRHIVFFPKTYEDEICPTQYDCSGGVQVYADGVCHSWGESETQDEVYLVSFDLSNEVFVKTLIPSTMDDIDSRVVFRHLNVLNGSIECILNYVNTGIFHISILGEIGVKESWIKLFIVGSLSCVDHPIRIGKTGDIFFRKEDDELVSFNLSTQKIEELGVKGYSLCQIIVYKESLLPIARINN
ncbi:hypothetical protein MtrunA17_Chr7g0271461 [Medicago truncatula]|uniref:F-box protein interaction domain protein n=1 Tax=Medicago truncatula TaxID=3880 RepID=A0A396HE46_MEDTR|nr:hypothetical protein MtrunA17_Chr7g0271461 [Medicago truncatula]